MHRKSNDKLQEQWRQTYSPNNVMNFARCKAKLTWNRIQETLIMLQFNRSCCEKGGDWKCTSMHAPSCHPAATHGSLMGREVWRLVLVSPQTTRVLRVYNVCRTWVVWSENRARIIASPKVLCSRHNTDLVPIQQLVSKAFARNVCSCLSTQVKVRCSSYVFNKAFYMKLRCIESLMIDYKSNGDKYIASTMWWILPGARQSWHEMEYNYRKPW